MQQRAEQALHGADPGLLRRGTPIHRLQYAGNLALLGERGRGIWMFFITPWFSFPRVLPEMYCARSRELKR